MKIHFFLKGIIKFNITLLFIFMCSVNNYAIGQSTDPMINFDDLHSGVATYYGATGKGNCSFDATPNNLMVAAMNDKDYYGSNACGAFVNINGPNGNITVRIVDRCPECAPGDIDLSQEAFKLIADPIDGRVSITWKYVEGEIGGPVQYKFKEGSSPYWMGLQVRNHLNPIKALEIKDQQGQWVELNRELYNYFLKDSGMGPGPYDIRLTDVFGQQLVDTGVELKEEGIVSGNSQFASVDTNNMEIITKDSDDDGVINEWDDCPDTPAGTPTDQHGCSVDMPCVQEITQSDLDAAYDKGFEEGRSIDQEGCSIVIVDNDYSISISSMIWRTPLEDLDFWLELEFAPGENGEPQWIPSGVGINESTTQP